MFFRYTRKNVLQCQNIHTSIVLEPVIANTVQMRTTSRYHDAEYRSGIGFGARNFCHIVIELLSTEGGVVVVWV